MPQKMAHPDPLYKVVLLLIMNIIAVTTKRTIAKMVTIQIVYFGRNSAKVITKRLRPTEIRTPQSKYSMDF